MQNREGVTRAVQQGKGSGISRNQGVRANAYRSETEQTSAVAKDNSAPRAKQDESAFRK
jgi:hypothetical protein